MGQGRETINLDDITISDTFGTNNYACYLPVINGALFRLFVLFCANGRVVLLSILYQSENAVVGLPSLGLSSVVGPRSLLGLQVVRSSRVYRDCTSLEPPSSS
jgi:hypothetical protein